jgi:alpha-beta hydrolase superfamily lysophospholipase
MKAFSLCLSYSLLLSGCVSLQTQEPGPASVEPHLTADAFITSDGLSLGLQVWEADDPVAVVVGLHGMNDYSKTFSMPGPWLADKGITTYAYDHRGFGRSPQRGIWPGTDLIVNDAKTFIEVIRARHSDRPLYVVGVSMGAAVAIATLADDDAPSVDGLVIVSPAVWGWSSLNHFYRMSLWIAAHTFPGGTLTGRSLDRVPSDNIEMLRDNFNDELYIKETRTDAIYGLVGLMEQGYKSADRVKVPTLLLYGEKDQIIPRKPVESIMGRLGEQTRFALYENGYHMLMRDLQAETVWADILSWLQNPQAALPSGEELIVERATEPRLSRNE